MRVDVFRTLLEQPGTLNVLSVSSDESIDIVGKSAAGGGGGGGGNFIASEEANVCIAAKAANGKKCS